MKLRLYVEDRYFQAYEILARKWHATEGGQCEVDLVQAVRLRPDRIRDGMYKNVIRARHDGFDCVVFALDQEAPHERSVLVDDVRAAFEQLCHRLSGDPELHDVLVGLVIVRSCLECWLLTEVQAIVRFACSRGGAMNYNPRQSGDTERFSPNQAVAEITHVLREVGRRQGKRNLKRIKYEKSASADIVSHIAALPEAVDRNCSLAYFCDMVTCQKDGCEHRQPDNGLWPD